MADFGATDLDAFAKAVRTELEAMYPAELRDPNAKTDTEAVCDVTAHCSTDGMSSSSRQDGCRPFTAASLVTSPAATSSAVTT